MVFFLLTFLFSFGARAYHCPPAVQDNPQALQTQEWLQQFKGLQELHGCEIEIEVCETGEVGAKSNPVGEIFLTDSRGREAYLLLDFPEKELKKVRVRTIHSPRLLQYKKQDRHYEDVNGRVEHWQLEMRTLWGDSETLDVLELGIYTTNDQLNQPNGNDSYWFVCAP